MKKYKFVVILLLISFLLVGCKNKEENNNINDNTPVEEKTNKNIVSYKGFDYELPEGVTLTDDVDKQFTLTKKEEWVAYVEIFHDKNHNLAGKPDRYFEALKAYHYNVDPSTVLEVNGTKLNCYNRHGEVNSIICTANYIGNFSYQIDYFDKSNDFLTDGLKEVVDIMNKSTYRYDDHTVFYYPLVDFLD